EELISRLVSAERTPLVSLDEVNGRPLATTFEDRTGRQARDVADRACRGVRKGFPNFRLNLFVGPGRETRLLGYLEDRVLASWVAVGDGAGKARPAVKQVGCNRILLAVLHVVPHPTACQVSG